MTTEEKRRLLELAGSTEREQLLEAAAALRAVEPGAERDEVLAALLGSVQAATDGPSPGAGDALQDALGALAVHVGPGRYLEILAGTEASSRPGLAVALLGVPVGTDPQQRQALAVIAGRDDVPPTAARWLAGQALATADVHTADILRPFAVALAGKLEAAEEVDPEPAVVAADAAAPLSEQLQEAARRKLSAHHEAGIVAVLGILGQEQALSTVGPAIEDVGAWERFCEVLLERDRLQGMFDFAGELGLDRALGDAMARARERGEPLADALARDRAVRRSLARMLASRRTFFAMCRFLVTPRLQQVLRELIGDTDTATRIAAAWALGRIGSPAGVDYLRSGLVDRHERVREVSAESMRSLVGEEEFSRIREEMIAENASLAERLKGLSEWAQGSLDRLGGGVSAAVGGVRTGAEQIGNKARGLFGKLGEWTDG